MLDKIVFKFSSMDIKINNVKPYAVRNIRIYWFLVDNTLFFYKPFLWGLRILLHIYKPFEVYGIHFQTH